MLGPGPKLWTATTGVRCSGIRWDSPSRLLFLGVFGWSAGVMPARVDGTIAVNRVMQLLDPLPMILLHFSVRGARSRDEDAKLDRWAFIG